MEFVYYEEVEMILDRALNPSSSKREIFYDRYEAFKYILKRIHVKNNAKNRSKIEKYMTKYEKTKGVSLYG